MDPPDSVETSGSGSEDSSSSSGSSSSGSSEGSSSGVPADMGNPMAAAAGSQPPAVPPAPDAGGDPAADQATSPEQLQAEYAQLPPDQLKMHLMAAHAALMAVMGQQGGDQGGAPPAPDASASPAPGPEQTPPPDMGKKEFATGEGTGGKVSSGKMAKSERDLEIETLKKSLKEQELTIEKFGKLAENIAKVISKPLVKSVRKISEVKIDNKPGTPNSSDSELDVSKLSREQVIAGLNTAIRTGKLSKSDKDLVKQFSVRSVGVEKVAHILTIK